MSDSVYCNVYMFLPIHACSSFSYFSLVSSSPEPQASGEFQRP